MNLLPIPKIHVGLALALTLMQVVASLAVAGPEASTPDQVSRIAGWRGAAPNSSEAFSFVVVSDRTGRPVPGQWAATVRQVNLLKPDFVISVGDLIEGYTKNPAKILARISRMKTTVYV